MIFGFTWLKKRNPDINWQTGKIKWWQLEGNEECILPSNGVCVNEPSEEIESWQPANKLLEGLNLPGKPDKSNSGKTTWTKPAASEPSCANYMEYWKATIKEESDTKEWMDLSDKTSVNGPLFDNLDNFNDITIKYIGTDASLMELHSELHPELLINATLKPSQAFITEYRKKETLTTEERVPTEYHSYLDVFKEEVEHFPDSRPWDHAIKTKPRFEPWVFKSYNLTLEEREQQELFIKENLKKGYIQPSRSPMASPFFFVNKKDGKLQPTQDYRYLNQWTIKNAYPLPLILEIMDKIKASGVKYFNVWWGFNNVCIKDGNQWKVAFKTNLRLYEPMVMFFGLCNSPSRFQAMMNNTLKYEIEGGFCIVYMDDILIFAKNKDDLKCYTKSILESLQKADLYLKPSKCKFCKTKIEYLGLIIEEGKMIMDPTKLNGICDWPIPKSVKQVRSFLGFGNFYWCFIWKFSKLA